MQYLDVGVPLFLPVGGSVGMLVFLPVGVPRNREVGFDSLIKWASHLFLTDWSGLLPLPCDRRCKHLNTKGSHDGVFFPENTNIIAFIKTKDLPHIFSDFMLDSRGINRASCNKIGFLDEIRHTSHPTQKSYKKSNVAIFFAIFCNFVCLQAF